MRRAFPQVLALLALDERDDAVLAAVRGLARVGACERVIVLHVQERSRRFGSIPLLGASRSAEPPPRPPALDALVAELDHELPDVEVVGIHAVGRAVEEIARVNDREACDLVVIGRSTGEEGRPAWGEHGLRVLRLADAPVLVVPDGHPVKLDRAVVGMDLSADAMDALAIAAQLTHEVVPLAVVDRKAEGLDDAAYDELRAGLSARYSELATTRLDRPAIPPLHVVDAASPADALLAAAAEEATDLLVIGSRGLTPVAAVLLGSTAERLGGRCRVPLLVWRAKGRQQGLLGALFGRSSGGQGRPGSA